MEMAPSPNSPRALQILNSALTPWECTWQGWIWGTVGDCGSGYKKVSLPCLAFVGLCCWCRGWSEEAMGQGAAVSAVEV